DTDDLVSTDFMFMEYSREMNSKLIQEISCAAAGAFGGIPEQVGDAITDLWQRTFLSGDSMEQTGIICRTLSGEFAGCITAAPASRRTERTVFLTSFFVPLKFRGLGIGTELLERHRAVLRASGKEWILLAYTVVQDSVEPLLLRSGFEKTDSGFMAKIQ
ncbi:MAG: GNAT family N-acetyltransferase, partial [Treponemataceae bacterium]|nr:GNAT family N-acetyltransferase [Treponemataceae bacterium]